MKREAGGKMNLPTENVGDERGREGSVVLGGCGEAQILRGAQDDHAGKSGMMTWILTSFLESGFLLSEPYLIFFSLGGASKKEEATEIQAVVLREFGLPNHPFPFSD